MPEGVEPKISDACISAQGSHNPFAFSERPDLFFSSFA